MSVADIKSTVAMDCRRVSHFRFVETDDATLICQLRSDPSLNQFLSPSKNDIAVQKRWIEQYKIRESQGSEFYFVIQHKGSDCGVVRMYDFADNRTSFSWGSWILKPSRPKGLVTYSAIMIYECGFDALGFGQSHFDVRKANKKVIEFHLRSGAQKTSDTDKDQFFVFTKEAWPAFKAASVQQIAAHSATLK